MGNEQKDSPRLLKSFQPQHREGEAWQIPWVKRMKLRLQGDQQGQTSQVRMPEREVLQREFDKSASAHAQVFTGADQHRHRRTLPQPGTSQRQGLEVTEPGTQTRPKTCSYQSVEKTSKFMERQIESCLGYLTQTKHCSGITLQISKARLFKIKLFPSNLTMFQEKKLEKNLKEYKHFQHPQR